MNELQTAYALALAAYQCFESAEADHERAYCAANGLLDTDGNPAQRIFHLNDADFDAANEAFTAEMEAFYTEMHAARDRLQGAEDDLVSYGLSIMPASLSRERDLLAAAAKNSIITRRKIIELAFRLDSRTVPRQRA
jgi:hypothetical protein